MTNFTKLLLITFLLSTSFAFTDNADNKIIGTYGVSENDPSQIELIINDDYSFTYQDFSNSKQKIQVYGTWKLKNNAIILHSNQADAQFHNKWRISEDGHIAKSRKGLTFYKLCRK